MENENISKMNLAFLLSAGLFLVILTIVLAFGQNILGDFKNSFDVNSSEYNGTIKGQEGLTTIQSKTPLIALIVVIIVIIGLLLGLLRTKSGE